MKKTTHTRSYTKKDGTKVRGYNQQRDAWKQAALSGSLSLATGLTALFLVVEAGFTLVSTLAVLVLASASVVAGSKTIHTINPNRTGSRPRPRTSGTAAQARKRRITAKARWRARRRKAAKWTRGNGEKWVMAAARAAGRGWRRMRNRPRYW